LQEKDDHHVEGVVGHDRLPAVGSADAAPGQPVPVGPVLEEEAKHFDPGVEGAAEPEKFGRDNRHSVLKIEFFWIIF